MANSKKVIVTNKSALVHKYGKDGFEIVEAAIKSLIGADQARFIFDKIVYVDSAEQMSLYKGKAVTNPSDDKQNKDAVDSVCIALNPDYVAVLGAQDIIPMQLLDNPADQHDSNVPSDLPYACSASYNKDISKFLSPTRVVGRIPGVPEAGVPDALLSAINTSISMKGRERKNFNSYFAVSADPWEKSSKQSISNICGNSDKLHLSPPDGPDWPEQQLQARVHFVNCHGSPDDPCWYGQKGRTYPRAVMAAQILNKIIPNTIVAAECCFGAQLYNPGGVCTSYLNSGIAAFCGSTNVAYGPVSGQDEADLITQYFLIDILNSSSAGSAMLSARQKYINKKKPMDVYDLKTIAQFNLLGDPSAHPVIPDGVKEFKALFNKAALSIERRIGFNSFGDHLSRTASFASKEIRMEISKEVMEDANKIFNKIKSKRVFETTEGPLAEHMSKQFNKPETRIYIIEEEAELDKEHNLILQRVYIAKEIGGKIVSSRVINSK